MIQVNEASGTETRETSWWLSVSLQFYLDPRDFIPKYWWSVSFNFRYLCLATILMENFIWLGPRGRAELGCHQHHFHYQHHHHPYPIIVPDGGSEVGLKLDVLTIAITIWDVPFYRLCSFNTVQNALDPPTPPTMLWTGDNFAFGQIWKFPFVYTFGIYWSFGIFDPTFDEQQSRFRVQSSQKIDIKNRKNEKMPQNNQFWAYFGVLE